MPPAWMSTSSAPYFTIMHRRGRPKAKVAVARKLLVRLFIMLRDQIDYDEFRRREPTARSRIRGATNVALVITSAR
jgi:hypothetical protein